MAPRNTPFTVCFDYTGQKSKEEIQEIYAGFYIQSIKDRLSGGNLSDFEKNAIIELLLRYHLKMPGEKPV